MRFKLETKIGLVFLIFLLEILIFMFILIMVVYHQVNEIDEEIEEIELMYTLRVNLDQVLMSADDFLISGARRMEFESFKVLSTKVEGLIDKIDKLEFDKPEEREVFNHIKGEYSQLKEKTTKIFSVPDHIGNIGARRLMEEMDDIGNDAIMNAEKFHQFAHEELEELQAGLQGNKSLFGLVILVGVLFNIVFIMAGLFFFRRTISLPIISIRDTAIQVGRGSLEKVVNIESDDEIGELAASFNEMSSNLKLMVEEVKRFTIVEERNRIAFDLHDGCTQELANIIKRIEFCEKLFKIDPSRAFEELATLKENTKDTLSGTRQVIFDLKSAEDTDFNLLTNLTSFIKSYRKQTDININLDIPGSINNISPDKSKSIFYIITEALTNIKKHSMAKNVELSLESDGNNNLMINIKDDGKGFDINDTKLFASSCGKWGLISMRQRAYSLGGIFTINSRPNQGTEVSINIPLTERIV